MCVCCVTWPASLSPFRAASSQTWSAITMSRRWRRINEADTGRSTSKGLIKIPHKAGIFFLMKREFGKKSRMQYSRAWSSLMDTSAQPESLINSSCACWISFRQCVLYPTTLYDCAAYDLLQYRALTGWKEKNQIDYINKKYCNCETVIFLMELYNIFLPDNRIVRVRN